MTDYGDPTTAVAATSRLFNLMPQLRDELVERYPEARIATGSVRAEDDLIEFLTGATVALIGTEKFTKRVIDALPDLEVVACCSAGVDHLDPALLQARGIRMGWSTSTRCPNWRCA